MHCKVMDFYFVHREIRNRVMLNHRGRRRLACGQGESLACVNDFTHSLIRASLYAQLM